jgi:hypothetical protein
LIDRCLFVAVQCSFASWLRYLSLAVLPRAGAASLINEMWMTLLTNAPAEHGVQAMIARHFVLFVIAQVLDSHFPI